MNPMLLNKSPGNTQRQQIVIDFSLVNQLDPALRWSADFPNPTNQTTRPDPNPNVRFSENEFWLGTSNNDLLDKFQISSEIVVMPTTWLPFISNCRGGDVCDLEAKECNNYPVFHPICSDTLLPYPRCIAQRKQEDIGEPKWLILEGPDKNTGKPADFPTATCTYSDENDVNEECPLENADPILQTLYCYEACSRGGPGGYRGSGSEESGYWAEYYSEAGGKDAPPVWDPAKLTMPGFGRHIPLFYLMENPYGCKLSHEVQTFIQPTQFGALITGEEDYCLYWMFCRYEEDNKQDDAFLKFYETYDKTFLIGLTWQPVTELEMMTFAQNDFIDLKKLDEAQRVVWSKAVRDPTAQEKEVPTYVKMQVEYFQKNSTHKVLVRSSMTFGNFTKVSDHPVYTTSYTGQNYVFVFELTALPWWKLLDQFALPLIVYIMFYFLVGAVLLVAGFTFWLTIKAQERFPFGRVMLNTGLNFIWYLTKFTMTPVYGFLLGVFPLGIASLFTYYVFVAANIFEKVTGDMKVETSDFTLDQIEQWQKGRTGLTLLLLGILIVVYGVRLLVPRVDDDEEGNLVFRPYFWQRSHVLFVSISVTLILLAVVEFSFSSVFKQYTVYFLVAFKVVFAGIGVFLGKSLSEKLILSPFVLTMQLTQFITKIGAEGFNSFVLANMVEFIMGIVTRIIIKPIVGEAMIFKDVLTAQRTAKKRGESVIEVDTRKLRKRVMVEALLVYAMESINALFSPGIVAFMYVFRKQLEVATIYGIRDTDLLYYLQFTLFLLPAKWVLDVFTHNALERFFGWPQYEYVKNCEKRFMTRTSRWIGLMQDKRPKEETDWMTFQLISLDHMAFSSQYYFMCCFHTSGMLCIIMGCEMIARAAYNVFADPMAFPIFVMLLVGVAIFKKVMWILANKVRLWYVVGGDNTFRVQKVTIYQDVYRPKFKKGDLDAVIQILHYITGIEISKEEVADMLQRTLITNEAVERRKRLEAERTKQRAIDQAFEAQYGSGAEVVYTKDGRREYVIKRVPQGFNKPKELDSDTLDQVDTNMDEAYPMELPLAFEIALSDHAASKARVDDSELESSFMTSSGSSPHDSGSFSYGNEHLDEALGMGSTDQSLSAMSDIDSVSGSSHHLDEALGMGLPRSRVTEDPEQESKEAKRERREKRKLKRELREQRRTRVDPEADSVGKPKKSKKKSPTTIDLRVGSDESPSPKKSKSAKSLELTIEKDKTRSQSKSSTSRSSSTQNSSDATPPEVEPEKSVAPIQDTVEEKAPKLKRSKVVDQEGGEPTKKSDKSKSKSKSKSSGSKSSTSKSSSPHHSSDGSPASEQPQEETAAKSEKKKKKKSKKKGSKVGQDSEMSGDAPMPQASQDDDDTASQYSHTSALTLDTQISEQLSSDEDTDNTHVKFEESKSDATEQKSRPKKRKSSNDTEEDDTKQKRRERKQRKEERRLKREAKQKRREEKEARRANSNRAASDDASESSQTPRSEAGNRPGGEERAEVYAEPISTQDDVEEWPEPLTGRNEHDTEWPDALL